MKYLATTLFASSLLFGSPAFSSGDHDDGHGHSHSPITSKDAIHRASLKVKHLAGAGKINASWSEKKAAGVEQKTYTNGPEWVITFKNDKVSDATKKTLYVFFSLDGHYIAANFTGN